MLKKEIKFEDFEGNECTEELYFNLSKADLLELNFKYGDEGGIQQAMTNALKVNNTNRLNDIYKDFIAKSYGIKKVDSNGRTLFVKDEKETKDFFSSPAFSELYFELLTDEDAMLSWMVGIMPNELKKEINVNDKEALLEKVDEYKKDLNI